jgi:gluconate 2-dehydrogenase alpha chain
MTPSSSGSGPGGSAAADVLTAAGWSVVIFEKGRNHLIDLDDPAERKADYANDEIKFMVRHFLGPDPLLEPRTFRRTTTDGEHAFVGDVNNVPSTVGGGGVHADGKLPRFREEDFRPLSEPAAERLGYHPYPAPTGANSVPYDGRPACNNCGFCAFYGCPIHAKGDPVAPLQRALVTGRAALRPETFVSKIAVRNGVATGVEYVGPDGSVGTETARHVVLAAGAIETPRLLLLSAFEHPLIGRNLMCHFQTLVMGGMPQRMHPHRGRSVTHVHDDHLVPDEPSRRAARALVA